MVGEEAWLYAWQQRNAVLIRAHVWFNQSTRVSWSVRDEKVEEVSSVPAASGLGLPGFLCAGFPDDQPHTHTS